MLTVAVEAHASEIALVQQPGRLRLDGDCAAEFPIGRDRVCFGAGHADLGHGDAVSHEGVINAHQAPIVSRGARRRRPTFIVLVQLTPKVAPHAQILEHAHGVRDSEEVGDAGRMQRIHDLRIERAAQRAVGIGDDGLLRLAGGIRDRASETLHVLAPDRARTDACGNHRPVRLVAKGLEDLGQQCRVVVDRTGPVDRVCHASKFRKHRANMLSRRRGQRGQRGLRASK